MLLAHVVALAWRAPTSRPSPTAGRRSTPPSRTSARRYLDSIHGDDVPALETGSLVDDLGVLYRVGESAIEDLVDHGVDPLPVELVLAMLEEARQLVAQARPPCTARTTAWCG